MRNSFLFTSLDSEEIFDLTMQFEIATYNVGEVIIEQGVVDDRGYYYMLTEGECTVFKNGKRIFISFYVFTLNLFNFTLQPHKARYFPGSLELCQKTLCLESKPFCLSHQYEVHRW